MSLCDWQPQPPSPPSTPLPPILSQPHARTPSSNTIEFVVGLEKGLMKAASVQDKTYEKHSSNAEKCQAAIEYRKQITTVQ